MVELRHSNVPVDDAVIHVVEAGPADAPAVVLLHGWPESWATWRELIPLAAKTHRVVALDLPGIGGSTRGSATGAKSDIARTIHALIGALELRDTTLVGHDIGGMVAYAFLREFPDLRRAVILDVPIPGVDPWDDFIRSPFLWHFALHAVPGLPEDLVAGRWNEYFGYFYDLLAAVPGVPTHAVRDEQVAAYTSTDSLSAGFDWYRAFDADVEYNRAAASGPAAATPLLYLRGTSERGGSIDAYVDGLRRAGVSNVTPALIEGAGHFPHQEQPVATWTAISRFIAAVGHAGGTTD
jgi:pimeloyl-ACP methyl ester carboxylesterase